MCNLYILFHWLLSWCGCSYCITRIHFTSYAYSTWIAYSITSTAEGLNCPQCQFFLVEVWIVDQPLSLKCCVYILRFHICQHCSHECLVRTENSHCFYKLLRKKLELLKLLLTLLISIVTFFLLVILPSWYNIIETVFVCFFYRLWTPRQGHLY